jgi:hypothetical protein
MLSVWTKHLKSEEEKERFRSGLIGSRIYFQRAEELLNENLETLQKEEISTTQFEDPNWAYKQAYLNGKKAQLMADIKLMTLDQKD